MAAPSSLVSQGGNAGHPSVSPPDAQTVTQPVSLVSVRITPSPCVQAVHLPNHAALLCFISGEAVSKPITSESPALQTHTDYLGEGFPALWSVPACCGR